MKTCTKCGDTKTLEEFPIDRSKVGTGRKADCLECNRIKQRAYRASLSPEERSRKYREGNLWRCYKIRIEDYDRLWEAQEGLCAICRKPAGDRGLFVDHDHVTKEVRGLLCWLCNSWLGRIDDSLHGLTTAIHYIGGRGWLTKV